MRTTRTIAIVILAGALLLVGYEGLQRTASSARIRDLEREKAELYDYVRRLGASRRVAQINVLDQVPDPFGFALTRLRWQEMGPGGLVGAPMEILVSGGLVYFEAFVLKFEHDYVARGDLRRGASLALFRRVFGERQAPDSVPMLEPAFPPDDRPLIERRLEQDLWRLFWRFVDQPDLAAEYGVRVAQCEAPAVPLRPGQVWEVTLDAAGGLNLRMLPGSRATGLISRALPPGD